ncbi:MAG TPA: PKD domain-containing protein [Myxococcaceae bacterium]|nr:PKD domain-containing protein [Myxococcaceae bacterium]
MLPAVIPPNGTATFVWSYTATGTGTISFSTGATGVDATTGGTVNAPTTPSNVASVVAPSGLTITSFSIPTSLSRGQTFTVTMQVLNNGGATAQQVVPDPPTVTTTGGAGAATSTSQTPVDITPGNSASFSWTYTENGTGPGTLQLSAGASGTDAVTGLDVFANPTSTNLAQVQDPARLQVSSFTIPTTLSRGQGFNAVMVVKNLGQATASSVLPSPRPPTLTRTGGANASTPTTFTPQTIPGGGQTTFTWAYTENGTGTGTLQLNAGAAGTDANSAASITGAALDSPVATVQAPAQLQVTVSGPARLSRGQSFNIQVTVTNQGDATALGVLPNPSPPTLSKTGTPNATTSSAPAAKDIPAGQSQTFLYAYTENGTGTGSLTFTTGATGTDANSGATVTAPGAGSGQIPVDTPAALAVSSFVLPANISRGSTFTAVLVVNNNGQATAHNVLPSPNPPTPTTTGQANATTSTSLTPVDIPGLGSATFTWTYTETGTGTGTLRLSTGATGTDLNSGATVTAAAANSNTANVQQAAALSISSFVIAPGTLSRGQTFTATMVVHNGGQAAANGVLPSPNPPSVSGTGGANATTSSTLTPATIAGGANATFTWTFTENGTGPGTLALVAGATGTDANSGAAVSAANATSNTVTVQTPPQLVVTSVTVPAPLSRGQSFNVVVVVTNNGQATANGVLPSPNPPTQVKGGGASATTSTALTAVNIASGASATFTYAYRENGTGTGTLQFSTGAAGTDANSGAAVTAVAVGSVVATVQTPAALLVTTLTIPGTISRGQVFTATAVVTNTGEATASSVIPSPSPPTVSKTQQANATCTGTPAPVTVAGGSTATFTWSCTENGNGTGSITLSTGATGTDVNSGAALTAPSVNSNTATVQNPGVLRITAFTIPGTLTRGQTFTASMTVQNTGPTAVNNVLPSPTTPTLTPTGGANATTGTTLTPQTLNPGASTTFTWSYLENGTGTGTLTLTAGAGGNDAGSGAPVSANATSTNLAQVQTAPALSVTAFTLPARISSGQTFTASITVSNTGQATASNVLPSPNPPTLTPTGSATAATATTLTPATIAGGGSATFQWTYTAGAGTGTIRLTAGATGTDANSSATVTAAPFNSNTATVEAPAQLSVTGITVPSTISRGQTFQVSMTVRNNGSATANGVLPNPNPPTVTQGAGAAASTSTALTPATIAGGATATFQWTYTENGTGAGTLSFSAGAAGTDANSGATVNAASSTSSTVTVQTPPNLQVTSFTLPANLSQGQTFTATMVVTNNGQATANGVLPSPNPPTLSRTGTANASTGTALTPATIAGGATATFQWTYTENGTGTGTIALSAGAGGTDVNSGGAVSAPVTSSNTANVQTKAFLVVNSLTLPALLSRGQTFTVTMVVNNTGQAAANAVLPSPDPLTAVVTGGAAATTTTTHTGITIAGGATATITWSYRENGTGTGTLGFQGRAVGTDANSGAALSSASVSSALATVQQPAALSVTSFTMPANLSRGQSFTATMVVTNSGQAAANAVLPSPNPPNQVKTGGANATTSTTLTPATIAGGSSATFQWTFTENGTGTGSLQLAAGAAGTDANSGLAISAASSSTAVAPVVSPAALTSAITAPAAAVVGDQFSVTMLVTNTGGAPANAVAPSSLAPTVTGVTLQLLSSPSSPATIPGGGNFTFAWTYSTSGAVAGTVRLNGNAAGTDAYSGAPVSSAASNSNTTNILTAATAGLTSSIVTKPRTVAVGDTFTVEMNVVNRSGATRSTITPSDFILAGPGQVALLSGPAPASFNLINGANATFSWSYRATGQGWVTFNDNATSTTPADTSQRTTSLPLAIRSPSCSVSTLVVNAGPDRAINCQQNAQLGGTPTASGGNPNYTYEWTPVTNVLQPLLANTTASPKPASTTYTVTVTDGDGCRASDSMVVTVSNPPSFTSISSNATNDRRCTGSSFTFSHSTVTCPSGSCNNAWAFGDGTTSGQNGPTKTYAAAGTYYVTYTTTDARGCLASRTLPVFVSAAGVFPSGPITLTPTPATVAADGTSTVTFNSQALSDCNNTLAINTTGMRFLVDTDRGTITNPDADGATAGIQVAQAGVTGGFGVSFTVRSDKVGGLAHVRAQSVLQNNSQARGWGTTTFTGSTSLPQVSETTPEGRVTVNPTRVGGTFTKAMSAATFTGANVTLREVGGGTCANPTGATVTGTVSYLAANNAALFAPTSAMDVLTKSYVLRLLTGLHDTANNPLDGNLNQAADGSPTDDALTCFGFVADNTPPTVSCTSLSPAALSADGDATNDTSTFTAGLNDDTALKSWRIQVRSEATGALVRTLSKVRTTNGSDTQVWDGKNDQGQVVPNGNYVLSASAQDAAGNRSAPCSLGLTVSSVLDSSELVPPP